MPRHASLPMDKWLRTFVAASVVFHLARMSITGRPLVCRYTSRWPRNAASLPLAHHDSSIMIPLVVQGLAGLRFAGVRTAGPAASAPAWQLSRPARPGALAAAAEAPLSNRPKWDSDSDHGAARARPRGHEHHGALPSRSCTVTPRGPRRRPAVARRAPQAGSRRPASSGGGPGAGGMPHARPGACRVQLPRAGHAALSHWQGWHCQSMAAARLNFGTGRAGRAPAARPLAKRG